MAVAIRNTLDKSNLNILIADDDPDIIEFVTYNLSREGYEVVSANDGATAIRLAKDQVPDLIILDVMMPGMDGIEVCRELRSNNKFEDTIITFLTARSEDYSQIAGFDSGGDDYITKPIRPRLLVSRINALMRRKSTLKNDASYHDTLDFERLHIDSLSNSPARNLKSCICWHLIRARYFQEKKFSRTYGGRMSA